MRELAVTLEPGRFENESNIEEICDRVRERVKRQTKKYQELKANNEEFQNLVVKELEGLNRQIQKRKSASRSAGRGNVNTGVCIREEMDESALSREKSNGATQEMFLNVFNSLKNYLDPPY